MSTLVFWNPNEQCRRQLESKAKTNSLVFSELLDGQISVDYRHYANATPPPTFSLYGGRTLVSRKLFRRRRSLFPRAIAIFGASRVGVALFPAGGAPDRFRRDVHRIQSRGTPQSLSREQHMLDGSNKPNRVRLCRQSKNSAYSSQNEINISDIFSLTTSAVCGGVKIKSRG